MRLPVSFEHHGQIGALRVAEEDSIDPIEGVGGAYPGQFGEEVVMTWL